MSSGREKALAKRNASTALMPPPPAPKRIKRPSIILDEDTYTSAISHIIRRDYFPGLAETDAQREYLSALESKDKGWIREAGKRLTQVMTPVPRRGAGAAKARSTRFESGNGERTPSVWGADTPLTQKGGANNAEEENEEGLGKLQEVDLDLGLGAFQAKYTSEDQESFNKILDRQNKSRFEKSVWMHDGNMYASKQRLAQQKVLEARKTGTDSSTDLVVRPSQDPDLRPAAPNTHKHTAFNTLMFNPEGIEDWAPTRAQAAEKASLAPPKRVLYHNTRLPLEDTDPTRPPSPTLSAVRDAIAGNPRPTASEAGDIDGEAHLINGYALVAPQAPSPHGDVDDDDDEDAPTDLLERFGAKSSSATPFTISESTSREKLHHRMVDRITASKRSDSESGQKTGSGSGGGVGKGLGIFTSETPRFLSAPTPAARMQVGMTPGGRKAGGLTPAAQRLFERVGGGTPAGKVRGGFGEQRAGNGQWTPTPRVKRKL